MNTWSIIAKQLGQQHLSPIEFYFALEALRWFVSNDKPSEFTATELALGARTYAKRFQEYGLVPYFTRNEALYRMIF